MYMYHVYTKPYTGISSSVLEKYFFTQFFFLAFFIVITMCRFGVRLLGFDHGGIHS